MAPPPNFFQILSEETPAVSKGFFDLAGAIQKDAGLDEKTFQLVYIGIQATNGAVASVSAHAGMAKAAGATREEVRGAVIVSMMTTGINGVAACLAAALEAYDNA
jgi:AhpD family alkylhydroperoxidase